MPTNKGPKCGCKKQIVYRNSNRQKGLCKHFEEKLPSASKSSIKAELTEEGVENIDSPAPWLSRSYSEEELRVHLLEFDLDELELQIVIHYVFNGLTYEAIAEKLGLPGASSAEYRLKKVFKRIEKEYDVCGSKNKYRLVKVQ